MALPFEPEVVSNPYPPLFLFFYYTGMATGIFLFVYLMLDKTKEIKEIIKGIFHYTIPKGIEDYKQWRKH